MPDAFAQMIPEARAFLRELAAHNTRDWFAAHKPRYDAELKAPATLLLDSVAQDWGRVIGKPLKPRLFRPQRDVRFSRDKTPYTTHLHMLWAEAEGGPGWFFGISPDYVTAGAGIMGFDKAQLTAWRAAVDGPAGARMADALVVTGARLDEPELKRVPAPYDKSHPQAALLRRKSLAIWSDIEDASAAGGLIAALTGAFESFRPVIDPLRDMI